MPSKKSVKPPNFSSKRCHSNASRIGPSMVSSAMLRTLSATSSVSVKTAKTAPSAPARSSPALTSVSRTANLPAKGLRPMLASSPVTTLT